MPVLVKKPLWRALLRTASRYDAEPTLRLLLHAPRDIEFDLVSGTWPARAAVTAKTASDIASCVSARAVTSLYGGARFYDPRAPCTKFRRCLASELRRAMSDHAADPDALTDAAFGLIRRLAVGAELGARLIGPLPRRAARASLTPRVEPLPGDVLLSHPLLRRDTVVLLTADGSDGHAMGLVTNSPTSATLGGRTPNAPLWVGDESLARKHTTGGRVLDGSLAEERNLRDDDAEPFRDHLIMAGGPEGSGNLTMLHPYAAVRGSMRVNDNLYYGGDLAHAAELVRGTEPLGGGGEGQWRVADGGWMRPMTDDCFPIADCCCINPSHRITVAAC